MQRREFLEFTNKLLVTLFGSGFFSIEELKALEEGKKPDLIWLHSMSCDGCSTSFLNAEEPFIDIISRYVNIVFHPTLMVSDGKDAMEILDNFKSDNLILVVEGALANKDMPHVCMMGERFMNDIVSQTAKKANIVISAGTCASFIGICDMKGMYTNATSLRYFLHEEGIDKPLINLPTCPMKPHHFLYVVFYYIKHGKLPPMDLSLRPLRFFGTTIHERCVYYHDYQENIFAQKIGDRGCLFKLGCQGPVTKNDCVKSNAEYDKYNCIVSGHPCIGCASENFPRTIMFKRSDDKREIIKYKDFKRI